MRHLPAIAVALLASVSYGQATPELKNLAPRSEWGSGLKAPPGGETKSPQAEPAAPKGAVVRLKSGGRLEGLLIKEDETSITLEVSAGTIGIRKSEIVSIEYIKNDLQEFAEREARTDRGDPKALWELAAWAQARQLSAQARRTAEKVLALDGEHAEARKLLGYQKLNGKWMTEAEAMRAKGFVRHEGRWIKKEELDAIRFRQEQERQQRLREEERRKREAQERRLEAERLRQAEERARARAYYHTYPNPYSYGRPYRYRYVYPGGGSHGQHHDWHHQPHNGPHYHPQHGYHYGQHHQNHHDWHDKSHRPERPAQGHPRPQPRPHNGRPDRSHPQRHH